MVGYDEIIVEAAAAVADSVPHGKEGGLWRVFRSNISYILTILPLAYLVLWKMGYL